MRSTDTVTISLTPDLAREVDRLAREEGRTRSDLLREAFRQYAERRRRWDAIFAYGAERSAAVSLRGDVIAAAVTKRRRTRRRLTR